MHTASERARHPDADELDDRGHLELCPHIPICGTRVMFLVTFVISYDVSMFRKHERLGVKSFGESMSCHHDGVCKKKKRQRQRGRGSAPAAASSSPGHTSTHILVVELQFIKLCTLADTRMRIIYRHQPLEHRPRSTAPLQ